MTFPDDAAFPSNWAIPSAASLAHALGALAEWRDRALCRDADPALFDPAVRGEGAGRWRRYPERVQRAVHDYCAVCPVRLDCRLFAAQANTEGVWGGEWRHRQTGGSRVEVIPVVLAEPA